MLIEVPVMLLVVHIVNRSRAGTSALRKEGTVQNIKMIAASAYQNKRWRHF